MTKEFQGSVRHKRFRLSETYSDDQIKHAHDIFRRVAKTALRYSVTGERPATIVDSAKAKHGTSFAGLMGSLHVPVGGVPENLVDREKWFDRALNAYRNFEADFSGFLEQEIAALQARMPRKRVPQDGPQSLRDKIRERKTDLREDVSESIRELANSTFRSLCDAADAEERAAQPAAETVDKVFVENERLVFQLSSQLRAELVDTRSSRDRTHADAEARASDVVRFFVRDTKGYLVQRIVELRAERIENAKD